ncbi:SusC/RagA family TonB-linked outer membrane protein [Arcticibacter sp. MXS-1]|uniref:SusC/RagA family TonB-linked outer membrane protein n=1 Tax=Arcticibacter sp. MXS-1 TaxID=3341726 RepID=UPI0035A89E43
MKKGLLVISFVLAWCVVAFAQNITVRGTVKDQKGEALPGVSVKVKGTTQGTSTGVNGDYTLSAPGNATLVVTYIGFKPLEVAVNGRTTVNVTLAESNQQLEEVVVVGYGSQRKKDITGAVSTVKASDYENRPIVSAAAALQGQAAGVNVTSPSGKPGSALAISVRGNTSLNAKNGPLYVVDGIMVENIDFLNPQDIESFSVLKDASSAAIYGSSGANGVVLITTKKGMSGVSKINVTAYTGFSNFPKKIDVLNNSEYLALMTEMGYTDPNAASTDWQEEVFGTGKDHNLQLAVSGGSEGNRYYVSGGYQKQKGVVAPADYDRYSMRLNLDNQPKKWLGLSTNLAFNRSEFVDVTDNAGVARGGTILSALTSPPTIGVFNADGVTYTSNPNKGGWENPVAAAFGPDQKSIDNRVLGNISADFKIGKGLSFKSTFGGEYQGSRWDYFLDPYKTDYGRAQKGLGKSSSTSRFVWQWDNTINYSRVIGKHNIQALAGHSAQESDYKYTYDEAREYPNGYVKTLNAAKTKVSQSTTMSQWSRRSFIGRINYAYNDTYLLTTNVRYDGSSRFSEDERWGWFPSLSAGWRINNEPFLKESGIFYDLKLRAGWGKTGNDGIGDYDYFATFTPNGTGGFNFNNLAKPLTWEKTDQTNVGLDLSVLGGRLGANLDYYIKKTKDLLVDIVPPQSSGFGAQKYNVGSMENKGFEIAINAIPVDQKSFRWDINGNIAFNRNKVTDLGQYTNNLYYGEVYERGNVIRVEKGQPLGAFYGYISKGVDPSTGDIVYADLDNNGTITAEDRTYIGTAQPDFTYALTNNLRYKNLSLSIFLQGVQGNDLFNASRMELEGLYDSKNQSKDVLRRWTPDNRNTDIPRAAKGNTDNVRASSRFVEDGSYLRLKSVTLNYALGKSLLRRTGLGRVNVYVTGQNLFTITNYKGFDPEVSVNTPNGPGMGIDYGTYPQSRTFIFGVNLDF